MAERGSDEELLAAFAGGDRAAFDVLVVRHQDRLFQFARWYVRDAPSACEDVVQEIWLQVFRSAASFRAESSFRTWLFGVGRNVCLRELRRRGAVPRGLAGGLDDEDGGLNAIPDGEPAPLERLELRERERLVREAVERLPEHYGVALTLREWEGLSYEDIARALDVPLGTVRSRLHNGLARLSAELKSLAEEKNHGL
jgi:RNA polymerase sigma-70 factor (ECF subfamily)